MKKLSGGRLGEEKEVLVERREEGRKEVVMIFRKFPLRLPSEIDSFRFRVLGISLLVLLITQDGINS